MITNETTTCVADRRNTIGTKQIPTPSKLDQLFTSFKTPPATQPELKRSLTTRSHSCNDILSDIEPEFSDLAIHRYSSTKVVTERKNLSSSSISCTCFLNKEGTVASLQFQDREMVSHILQHRPLSESPCHRSASVSSLSATHHSRGRGLCRFRAQTQSTFHFPASGRAGTWCAISGSASRSQRSCSYPREQARHTVGGSAQSARLR